MKFKIGKILVGKNKPCLIVAELSANHNGSFHRLKKLILEASKSGADIIKIQTYTPDTITLKSNKIDFKINKKSPWKNKKNLWHLYNKAHTPWEWHKKIFEFCKKKNISIFSSPFDETAVEMLEQLRCPAYKIASAEINHIPLIEKVARTKKPIILSRGLASLKDLKLAIKTIKKNGNNKIAVLHCVSSYPSPIEEQNLNTIPALKKKIKTIVGLSDHTLGTISAVTSVALGASIIEKHFNLNDNNKTVDSFFSLKKNEFKTMVEQIRNVEKSLGKINLGLTKSSKKNLNSRRSIYVTALIKKGEILTTKNIRVVRPAFGLSPKLFKKILGKKVNKDLFLGDRMKFRYISK